MDALLGRKTDRAFDLVESNFGADNGGCMTISDPRLVEYGQHVRLDGFKLSESDVTKEIANFARADG